MDIDRYLVAHQASWDRLEELTARARRGIRRLDPDELDELVARYQRTSTHLSYVRTNFDSPALTIRLTRIVAAARGVIYGKRARTVRAVGEFFTTTFPAAVWDARRFVVASFLLTFLPALAMGAWIANSDAALEATAPAALREAYVNEDFESYYSSAPAGQFATEVTVNNIQVSILAFAAGILLCVGAAYVLVLNGANVGVAAGLFVAAGEQPKFWGLILPHGLLELTAVVIAGAAGLRLGWAIIAPGDRRRTAALADAGRRSVVIIMGLVAAFVTAGLIEGFVTGSALPTWARVGLGASVELAFVSYLVVQGRAAAARGITGVLGEVPRGWDDERGWDDAPTDGDGPTEGDGGGTAGPQSRPVALTAR
ncbi:MAG: stage II sporulation protein M [Acidimicrobiales bacterium]|nr:stage II sporulation protein M [Acidimicrobiales bacterium]